MLKKVTGKVSKLDFTYPLTPPYSFLLLTFCFVSITCALFVYSCVYHFVFVIDVSLLPFLYIQLSFLMTPQECDAVM